MRCPRAFYSGRFSGAVGMDEIRETYVRPSYEPETTNVPSLLKLTAVTGSECARIVFRCLPGTKSHV